MRCAVEPCERPAVCKGCCDKHYRLLKKYGDPLYAEKKKEECRVKPRPCIICQTVFIPDRHRKDARFCSKRCIWVATKGPEFNAKIAKESAAKRGDAQRGKGDGKTYRKLNGRHEHRLVAAQNRGYPLQKGEIVHHKDGNKFNNDPDNLAIITQGQHLREHKLWEWRWRGL